MSFLESIWGFLSVIVIAWTTQRVIAFWERKKNVEKYKLSIYMEWVSSLAKWYSDALLNKCDKYDEEAFLQRKLEILGVMQIMGPDDGLDAVMQFCDLVEARLRDGEEVDPQRLHESWTKVNYVLCCEIHKEKAG